MRAGGANADYLQAERHSMNAVNPLLKDPEPDFDRLVRVLGGEEDARKVHQFELAIDVEILQAIAHRFLDGKWIPNTDQTRQAYIEQIVKMHFLLGYDFVLEGVWRTVWRNHPPLNSPSTADTAGELARERREWANEGLGIIATREAFQRFPWDEISVDFAPFEMLARCLPPGMKIVVSSACFEHVLENLLGYRGLFYLLYDDPDLVADVFTRWGQIVYDFYESVVEMEEVGAIFHADDLGYKTSLMLSPDYLRQHVFPWFKKYADLAHRHNKPYWYHCCGNVYAGGIIEDLIEDVGIDGFHSFEKAIIQPGQFKDRYGDRVAMMGCVDVDNLTRMNEDALRGYVRNILDTCMPRRFALGSGNTVANYVPLENYTAMLDEARRWDSKR